MTDVSSTYQEALKLMEEFLKRANEFTKENKERLERLGEIAKIVDCKEEDKYVSTEVKQCAKAIKQVCKTLLFGCYMEFTSKIADRSSMIKEIESNEKEEKSSKLTEVMQIKFDGVKHYLEKANGRMKEVDDILSELVPKVREAYRKKFKIPDEEIADLKMYASDVNSALDACKKYLDEAERELGVLESKVDEEMERRRMTYVAGATALSIVVAGVTVYKAGPEAIMSSIKKLADILGSGEELANAAAKTGELAVKSLTLMLKVIIDRHKKTFMPYIETLKTELQKAKTEYDIKQNENKEKVTKRMGQEH